MVFFDALRVKIREDAVVRPRRSTWRWACALADGTREILGLDRKTEGAKFWLKVFNDLEARAG